MGTMTSDKFAVIAFYVYSKSAIWNNLNGSEDDLPLKRVLDDSKMTPKIRNTLISKMHKHFEWKCFVKHGGRRKSSISKISWFINVLNVYVHLN